MGGESVMLYIIAYIIGGMSMLMMIALCKAAGRYDNRED